MSEAKYVGLSLKVVINKKKTRVLFAEIDNNFANVLFSFLILPLGKIIYALDKHYGDKTPHVIGSLNTLYHSLANLHTFKFQYFGRKPSFLNINSAYAFPYLNQNYSSDHGSNYFLDQAYFLVLRVFTEENASFYICDDLQIVPKGNGSIVQTLDNLGVDLSDTDGAETRIVTFGLNGIMDLLKGLLISRQPLTDFILGDTAVKYQPGILSPYVEKEATSNYFTKKYKLKVMLQKSTRRFLFAQAEKDFVSHIATLLTIPLGIVDLHLGGNTCLNKVHNLYRALVDLINPKYLEKPKKVQLMKPETFASKHLNMVVSDFLNSEGPKMYMIYNDLTVRRLCLLSTLSLFNEIKVSASDVEEVELEIGLEGTARNILKASLMSIHAISDGLNNSKFTPLKPKEEVFSLQFGFSIKL